MDQIFCSQFSEKEYQYFKKHYEPISEGKQHQSPYIHNKMITKEPGLHKADIAVAVPHNSQNKFLKTLFEENRSCIDKNNHT